MVLPSLSLSVSLVEMKRTAACLKWKMWQTVSKQFGSRALRLPEGNFIIELLVRYRSSSRSKPRSDRLQSADSRRRKKLTMQYAEIPGNSRREFYDDKFPGIPGNSRTGIPGGLGLCTLLRCKSAPPTPSLPEPNVIFIVFTTFLLCLPLSPVLATRQSVHYDYRRKSSSN